MEDSANLFDKYASWYADNHMDVQMYSNALDIFLEQLADPSANVLDIACGPGNIASYLLHKNPSLKILGIDKSPNMVKIAKSKVPNATFEVMDVHHIANLDNSYSGIVLAFLLPYLQPKLHDSLFFNIKSKLKKTGLLYLSTIEGDPAKNGWQTNTSGDRIQMYFYRENQLKKILKKQGGEILHFEKQDLQKPSGEIDTNLIAVAHF
jgi:predicted TPR repeat methyltransferase